MKEGVSYWLIKSEPESYGIDALKKDKKTPWTGVRNYQARNNMRAMKPGDGILFYHSSCAVPGVYGIAEVASLPYPDESQFDAQGDYFESRATREKPLWDLVDVKFVQKLTEPVTLAVMRKNPQLSGMAILQKGSRLSVTPVTEKEFKTIINQES